MQDRTEQECTRHSQETAAKITEAKGEALHPFTLCACVDYCVCAGFFLEVLGISVFTMVAKQL